MPTAFTVSMLAWGALAFPSGYQKARQMPHVLQTMRWGSDYLLKTWKPDTLGPRSAGYLIIYQVQLLPWLALAVLKVECSHVRAERLQASALFY